MGENVLFEVGECVGVGEGVDGDFEMSGDPC